MVSNRACSRRQPARFKSKLEATEDSIEIDDDKFHASSLHDNPFDENGETLSTLHDDPAEASGQMLSSLHDGPVDAKEKASKKRFLLVDFLVYMVPKGRKSK